MSYCPCCSDLLLQHIRGSEIYWFCRHCWQEMPVWEAKQSSSLSEQVVEDLPTIRQHNKKSSATVLSNKRKSRSGWIGIHDIPA